MPTPYSNYYSIKNLEYRVESLSDTAHFPIDTMLNLNDYCEVWEYIDSLQNIIDSQQAVIDHLNKANVSLTAKNLIFYGEVIDSLEAVIENNTITLSRTQGEGLILGEPPDWRRYKESLPRYQVFKTSPKYQVFHIDTTIIGSYVDTVIKLHCEPAMKCDDPCPGCASTLPYREPPSARYDTIITAVFEYDIDTVPAEPGDYYVGREK
jgi:hypothetical protein